MNWKVVFAGLAFAVMTPGPRAGDGTKVGLANLDEIRSFPSAYLQVAFQLDVLYNGTGEVYNPFYTVFEPSGWYNFSAWGADTPVWEKDRYQHPHRYFYVDRNNVQAFHTIGAVTQRTWLRVTCRVRSTFHDQPWIEVLSVDEVGKTLDRSTLSKLVRGWTYAEQGDFERAVVEMESANLSRMPRPFVAMQRMEFARCAMRAGDFDSARNALAQARSLDQGLRGLDKMTADLDSVRRDPTLARAERGPAAAKSTEESPSVLIPYRDLGGGAAAVAPNQAPRSTPTETVEWSPTTGSETESSTPKGDGLGDWTTPPSQDGVEIEIEVPGQPESESPTTEQPESSGEASGSVQGEMTILKDTGPEEVLDIEWPMDADPQSATDAAGDPSTATGEKAATDLGEATTDTAPGVEGLEGEVQVPAIAGLEQKEGADEELLDLIELSPLPFETEKADTGSVASVDGSTQETTGETQGNSEAKSEQTETSAPKSPKDPKAAPADAKSEAKPAEKAPSGWDTVPPVPPKAKSGSEVPPVAKDPATPTGASAPTGTGADSNTQQKKEGGD